MQELTETVTRLHQEVVALMTTPRLDAAARQKLAEVAQEALRLSQELSKLSTELAVRQHQTGLFTRVWDFLARWVPILNRLKDVS